MALTILDAIQPSTSFASPLTFVLILSDPNSSFGGHLLFLLGFGVLLLFFLGLLLLDLGPDKLGPVGVAARSLGH